MSTIFQHLSMYCLWHVSDVFLSAHRCVCVCVCSSWFVAAAWWCVLPFLLTEIPSLSRVLKQFGFGGVVGSLPFVILLLFVFVHYLPHWCLHTISLYIYFLLLVLLFRSERQTETECLLSVVVLLKYFVRVARAHTTV